MSPRARLLPLAAALILAGCTQVPGVAPGAFPSATSGGTTSVGQAPGAAPRVVPTTAQRSLDISQFSAEIDRINADLRALRDDAERTNTLQDLRLQDALVDFNRRLQVLEAALSRGVISNQVNQPQVQTGGAIGSGNTSASGTLVRQQPQPQPVAPQAAVPQFDEPDAPLDEPVPTPIIRPAPATGVTLAEQNRYDQAFALLKQSRYAEAVAQFRQLLADSPATPLAADVYYWIGEVQYINREFALALEHFEQITERYPRSDRVPEALLKIGYVQYDIGDYTAAARTFQNLLTRFPGHPTNLAAQTRLQRLQNTIQN